MQTETDISDEDVWQGYVSAVASLLMTLLLLLAVIVLSISILAALESSQSSGPLHQGAGERETGIEENAADNITQFTTPQVGLPESHSTWRLIFPSRTVEIPDHFAPTIAHEFQQGLESQGQNYQWILTASSNGSSTAQMRLAYMRIIAVRNLLLSEGIAAANVQLNIIEDNNLEDIEADMSVLVSRVAQGS